MRDLSLWAKGDVSLQCPCHLGLVPVENQDAMLITARAYQPEDTLYRQILWC